MFVEAGSAAPADGPLLVLDLCLDIFNSVRGLDLKCDGLPGESLHKDLHLNS